MVKNQYQTQAIKWNNFHYLHCTKYSDFNLKTDVPRDKKKLNKQDIRLTNNAMNGKSRQKLYCMKQMLYFLLW